VLLGFGGLNLPADVPANEFLTIEGKKVSTSHNWAVWLPEYLRNYAPDPLRYVLSANMPETNDTDFSWREYVRRNNDELVATYGNLVHRVLTFTYKNFEGKVPVATAPDASSRQLLAHAKEIFDEVDGLLARCNFKQALKRTMDLAHETNRYLDGKAPWKSIKIDRQQTANSLAVAIDVIAILKTMFYPYLPFSSGKLHEYLGFEGSIEGIRWEINFPAPGQTLRPPQALFVKYDEEMIKRETQKLGH
jgi:methionyl-tRNA synthetase